MSTRFIPTGAQSDAEKPSWHIQRSNISTKSRAAKLTATALATVFNDRIPVEDYTTVEYPWDENDYSILESVAVEIDEGTFNIETLKWKTAGAFKDGTNYIQRFVLPALAAYLKARKELALKDGENANEVLAQLEDSDRAYLISFLGVDDKAHPMFTLFN
ncbi:hypothetical protein DFJ58DRAFT_657996 [Suillus subalutaceus]|uniref:uncharacterized protein n=1 Tax=Suillus subalutaceus TaxID=48586 RepID=UPI001B886FA4|nr:uncharacterized protein DFJ58DRAFT_657996 [Suillus subalutaceus]KAG1860329.1 hypothetical protein DFJ58DRAFT_657996 [Suillus subalutaceus]